MKARLRGPGSLRYSQASGPLERNPSCNNVDISVFLVDWLENEPPANTRSQELVIDYVAQTFKGSVDAVSLLDVACGNGRLYRGLQSAGLLDRVEYYGSDITPKLIEACRTLMPGVPFQQESAEKLPYEDGSFDVVVCQHAIPYLVYYDRAVREMLRVAGRLVLLVVKGIGTKDDLLGTYWNEQHKTYFRSNLYEPTKLKAFARSNGAALAFTLNDARYDDPAGQYVYVFYKDSNTGKAPASSERGL